MAVVPVQKQFLKAVLSLPTPVLRAVSGGAALYLGGRTLDPRFQFLLHMARQRGRLDFLPPDEAREAAAAEFALVAGPPEPKVRTEAFNIDGPRGEISVRAHMPADQDPDAPALVYAHYDAGDAGDAHASDAVCGILARCARTAVLAVPYRFGTDNRFPAGLEDVLAAYHWVMGYASRIGAPEGRAAVGGDSVGGNLAAVLCQELKRAGAAQPALQLLLYPVVDMASETPSMTTYADAARLSHELTLWRDGQYMGPDSDPADPRLSPLKAPDLTGLAPAVVVTAGFDPLVDQGELYARRLRGAGVSVLYRSYDNLAHGFADFTGAVPAADIACREIGGLLREGLEGRIPAAPRPH
jgi:acetyl esterase